jgi:VanZ family protein
MASAMVSVLRGKQRYLWVAGALCWIALILYSSTNDAERRCDAAIERLASWLDTSQDRGDDGKPDYFVAKKAIHVALFLTLAFVLSKALDNRNRSSLVVIACLGVCIGSTSELLQQYFPGRTAGIGDALLNASVTSAGGLLFRRRGGPQATRSRVPNCLPDRSAETRSTG